MEQLKNQLQGLDAQLGLVRQRLQKKSEQFEVGGNGVFLFFLLSVYQLFRLSTMPFFIVLVFSIIILSKLNPYLPI